MGRSDRRRDGPRLGEYHVHERRRLQGRGREAKGHGDEVDCRSIISERVRRRICQGRRGFAALRLDIEGSFYATVSLGGCLPHCRGLDCRERACWSETIAAT